MSVKCFHCKASNYTKEGYRKTANRGKIQKYKCQECKRYFTNDEGFYRMRNSEANITKAIDLYFSNLSSRKVRNQYKRHESTKISHVSILDWCRRYTLKVQRYVDTLTPKLSGNCYADDTEIDCGNDKHHFWVSVDWDTRFINATHYSLFADTNHAVQFLSKMKNNLPKYVQTDSAIFYPKAFRETFNGTVEHRANNTKKTGKHNVRIETVFSKIKDRVHDFRGLKATWSAPILLAGIVIQHNYIEAHTTTKTIPCELACIQGIYGVNKWRTLIQKQAECI